MRLYTRQHLAQRLRRENLPSSDNTLDKYRKKGIIPQGDFLVEYGSDYDMVLYSQERLNTVVQRIREYKDKKRRVCAVLKCDREHYARGFCRKHYMSRYYFKNKEHVPVSIR